MTTTVRCPVCGEHIEVASVLNVRFPRVPRHRAGGLRCKGSGRPPKK